MNYPHTGLYDCVDGAIWIARKKARLSPLNVSHATLIIGGSGSTSVADKDRFLCIWFHTPNTGSGLMQGYPIEWDEAHLMVRMDPNWDYASQKLLPSTDTRRVERNIDRQYRWGERIFKAYVARKPKFPLSWHLVGPRPADSMFYVERCEP
ncbi:MAG: hypothetical protein ACYTGQ_14385 [Planctomycetota bacterium]